MADKNDSDKHKKQKKKHKKAAKSLVNEQGSAVVEIQDTNASVREKTEALDESAVSRKELKSSLAKKAPNPQSSNQQWTHEQEELLLKNVKKYSMKLSGKQEHSHRVDWSLVEQVDSFTEFEMQEQYKKLTKKVRKIRSALEIVNDALVLHKEIPTQKKSSATNKIAKQAPNAFSVFCKAKRASLVAKHPELKFMDIHKKLCEGWKELPEVKREKYIKRAEKAKEEYYEELRKTNEELISQVKKPMSAFDLWKSERLEDGDLEGTETESDFLLEWEKLPKSTKRGWVQASVGDEKRYNLEVQNLRKGNPGSKRSEKEAKKGETKVKSRTSDEQQQSSSSLDNSTSKKKMDVKGQSSTGKGKLQAKKLNSKAEEESSSDDSSSSSAKVKSGVKRKMDSSVQLVKSPVKKAVKKDETSSESSSNEEPAAKHSTAKGDAKSPIKKVVKKQASNSESSVSSSDEY